MNERATPHVQVKDALQQLGLSLDKSLTAKALKSAYLKAAKARCSLLPARAIFCGYRTTALARGVLRREMMG